MESAIAVLLKFYKDDVDHAFWQNFWVNESVDGHAFVNFNVGDILMNRTADEGGITMSLPATKAHLDFLETAIANEYLCLVQVIEMPVGATYDVTAGTLVAQFVGEVVSMQTDLTTIEVELGAAMDAISGDIPGRKITTSLVGRLPSL
jgi:hypothetical protein